MNSRILSGAGIECRRAVRGLARAPGFAIGVVLVLGIAITGLVTVATAAYSLFLRPLPFAHPEQLAQIVAYSHSMGFDVGFSPPMLAEMREEPMVADVAAWHGPFSVESANGDNWQRASVTHNLAKVLDVPPVLGRSFSPADAKPGALPVVLISEATWRNRFDAASSVIGSEVELDGKSARVVGVMPATFTVPAPATQLWEPLRYTPEQLAPNAIYDFMGSDGMVARLEPGHTAAQLEDALLARYAADMRLNSPRMQDLLGLEFRVRSLRDAWTAEQREPLAVIGLASLIVLSAALFNVAGLWLARLLGRSHDQAVQAALGAGGWRRLSGTLIEFMLLGAAGACVALALSPLMLGWLKDLGALNLDQPLPIEAGSVTGAITVVVLALGGLPVLLAAAWQQQRQRRDLVADLSGGGRGWTRTGQRTRRVLIMVQVALAMSLLCAMGLLLRSWHGLLTEDLGFEPQNLLVAKIDAPADPDGGIAEPDPRVAAALDELRAVPGVTSVTHANVAPFSFAESMTSVLLPGEADRETSVRNRNVGEEFFRTIGIPLLRGRSFEAGDAAGTAIVDERFASLHFPAGGAVGERIRVATGPEEVRDAVIVGVAATVKFFAPDEQPEQGSVYQFSPDPLPDQTAVIAARIPPATLVEEVKSTLQRTLGADRTGSVVTMESRVRDTVRDREPQLILLGLFGLETLALAAVGLFSLLAYSVRARIAEFGVRQALGANGGDIRRLVLADAVRLLIPGLAIGIAGAWLAGYFVADRLYEVSPFAPVTWFTTGMVLVLVVLAAGLWPAARAARIEPTEALRYE